jgi:hypothetical protein
MFRVKHKILIALAGIVWLIVGASLLTLGLRLITETAIIHQYVAGHPSLLSVLAPISGGYEQAGMVLIALALALGYFKSRFVLIKTVRRAVARIRSFAEPVPIYKLYSPVFYLLIAFMMGLGMLMRASGIPADIRGVVDVAVGSALINGGVQYFRQMAQVPVRS